MCQGETSGGQEAGLGVWAVLSAHQWSGETQRFSWWGGVGAGQAVFPPRGVPCRGWPLPHCPFAACALRSGEVTAFPTRANRVGVLVLATKLSSHLASSRLI